MGSVGRFRRREAGLSLLEVLVAMLLVSLAAVSLVQLLVMGLRVQAASLERFLETRERWNRLQAAEAEEPWRGREIRVLDWEEGWIPWSWPGAAEAGSGETSPEATGP